MSNSNETEEEKPIVAKTAVDLQRLKLQKLMKNPEKPIIIPERPKVKSTPTVPEFVRNVMGSSAGAGSGEFHVYRHLRRKEYARQKFIQEKGQKELLDEEYHRKLEENKRIAEEVTAKKRAKRLKKKQRWKQKKQMKVENTGQHSANESCVSEEESSDDQEIDNKDHNTCEYISNNETSNNNNKSKYNKIEQSSQTNLKECEGKNSVGEVESHMENVNGKKNNSEIDSINEICNNQYKILDPSLNTSKSKDSREDVCITDTDS